MLTVDPQDKAKLIDPLFKTPRSFWVMLAILSALVSWGVYHYIRQISLGLGETGMDRPSYWGIYMVNFIFFIGISHAGTLISAILRVTGAEWRRPITRVAEAITAFALIVGTLQIIIDMGRPERLWFVLVHGRIQSPILWDVISVTAYFLGSVTYLYLPLIPDAAILRDNTPRDAPRWQATLYRVLALGWRGNRTQWLRLERAISVMAIFIIPVAISVHTIISWILATTVQPGWHSSIFGPYFVVGAIFSGIGALFMAMTVVRRGLGLEQYIAAKQYRNLGLLFVTMTAVWAYFTYAEHLGIAAGQQTEEFPVLASKLWGEFATGFWLMVVLMIIAFWILTVPEKLPSGVARAPIVQPRAGIGALALAGGIYFLIRTPQIGEIAAIFSENATVNGAARVAIYVLLALAFLGGTVWLRGRHVAATVVAAFCVVIGMWLERWNIIVPTMTHPRLIPYSVYQPTVTEIALTVGSLALFALLFLVFFKLFPAISIWEIAEGRVIAAAEAQIHIPEPEPVRTGNRRLGFKPLE